MKVKVFNFKKSYFSMWDIPADHIDSEINSWLTTNPDVEIVEICHDRFQGIWFTPQLIVSIYYR